MRIERAELSFLEIPFRLSVTHGARADRTFSDSMVIRVEAEGGVGFGEAVVRDYVSGSLGSGADFREQASRTARRILSAVKASSAAWRDAVSALAALDCGASELPLLCAVETAVLDLACGLEGRDIYAILGREPARTTVAYGGVMPILPLEQARAFIRMYAGFGFPDFKVKVNGDLAYNSAILGLCRQALGAGADIRVDANASWEVRDADDHLAVCERFGVRVVEQPFPVGARGAAEVSARARGRGFDFMADEGFLTAADVASIAAAGACNALNLRLSKNGGLSRVLAMADDATANGLTYQLGCMVGETGILSALGRVAASLLPAPRYLEGSYDDILLTANVTAESLRFGPGGAAAIVRGRRIGFEVDQKRLEAVTVWRAPCL
jgi:L-alanine-DL-glutamate epimerase-like enolase superfamily enzyme